MTQGIIFDIQRFCVDDGPGIRTTVFLKGCQMRCAWCHNPESLSSKPQLSYNAFKCISCQKCVDVCPNQVHQFDCNNVHNVDFDRCKACGQCVESCPSGALTLYGKTITVDDAFGVIKQDESYFCASNGGVTLSGGEALKQFKFSLELAKKCHGNGIDVCIETNGASRPEYYEKIAPYISHFLFDYKVTGEKEHVDLTGFQQSTVLDNLERLNQLGAAVILRCPIIPNCNLSTQHFKAIAQLANRLENIQSINILPYHDLGVSKAKQIGVSSLLEIATPKESEVKTWVEEVRSYCTRDIPIT